MAQDKRPKILCVDDERLNLKLLKSILEPEGYEFEGAENGEAALTSVAREFPEIILLDIMMPKMTGFEVLEKLRADSKTRLIPVVMVTALRDSEDKVKALEAGCDDFVSKPFDRGELLARVKSLLRIKSLHDEVENSYKKLKELEKLKDNLIHMIVHDFNNPLTAVSGNLQLLQLSPESLTDTQKEDVERALVSCNCLQRMAKDLLDVNRMEEGHIALHLEKIDLGALAKEAALEMKVIALWEKKELLCEIAENMPAALADKELIARVIINLISNAIKFTREGARIMVNAGYDLQENKLYVQVKDSGMGIAPQYLGRLFDKFMQIEQKEAKHGYGLGLTFCKMAVEAHGGTIKVESQEGKGSTFVFTLPVTK